MVKCFNAVVAIFTSTNFDYIRQTSKLNSSVRGANKLAQGLVMLLSSDFLIVQIVGKDSGRDGLPPFVSLNLFLGAF